MVPFKYGTVRKLYVDQRGSVCVCRGVNGVMVGVGVGGRSTRQFQRNE